MGNIFKTNKSKKQRALAFLLASLLIVLSFPYTQFSLTLTVAVEDASLINNLNGDELEPSYTYQTYEETTHLYLWEGYLIWASSLYGRLQSPTTVEHEESGEGVTITAVHEESGEGVTVTADHCYLTAEHTILPIKNSETHEHDSHDFKVKSVLTYDRDYRRLKTFSQMIS